MTVTRFAPSPTGYMHVGNLRTALYSYLIARADNGRFILRIEDTDRERLVPGAVDIIMQTLALTGIQYDEGPAKDGGHGPYVQSERRDIYKAYAQQLIDKGAAYYCFCDRERLEKLQDETGIGGYDRHCRNLSAEQVSAQMAAGVPYVIRQKMPLEGVTSYNDLVFGEISTANSELQDQVLMKADGYPTYNFAHVVDDYLMGVTHVVRGNEYLTSTPKYVLLYDAFGWPRPQYVHLPLMMGRDAEGNVSKLSKRHGAVSFQDLLAGGYLPAAILNYIAFLGWCPQNSEQEIFSLAELEQVFSIAGISKSAPVFDYDKLKWYNSKYIQLLSLEQFQEQAAAFENEFIARHPQRARIESLIKDRIDTLADINAISSFLQELPDYEAGLFVNKKNKVTLENAPAILKAALPVLQNNSDWDNDTLFAVLKEAAADFGCKTGAMMWVVRVAVSGLAATPGGATEIMEVLGQQESLRRLELALAKLA